MTKTKFGNWSKGWIVRGAKTKNWMKTVTNWTNLEELQTEEETVREGIKHALPSGFENPDCKSHEGWIYSKGMNYCGVHKQYFFK